MRPCATLKAIRWWRAVTIAVTAALLVWAVVLTSVVLIGTSDRGELGYDARLYVLFGQRLLMTGEFYSPIQFVGSYAATGAVNLYPPLAAYLFVTFSYAPLILWWVVPIGVFAWHVYDCRPARWTWPLMALIFGLPATAAALAYGNSSLWTVALVALACRRGEAAPLMAFKPTDLVGALVAVKRWRQMVVGLVFVLVLSLPLGQLWEDWIRAMSNAQVPAFRNLASLPMITLPLIAWAARTRRDRATDGGSPRASP